MTDFAALAASQLGGAAPQAQKPTDYASLAAAQLAVPAVPVVAPQPESISPDWDKATEAHLTSPSTWLGPAARYAVGGTEAFGAGAFGMGQAAAAGLTGLGRMGLAYVTGDDPQAAFKEGTDTINNLAAKVPIAPVTTAGHDISNYFGDKLGAATKYAGDVAFNATGSPLAGATAQAGATLGEILLPAKVGEAYKAFVGKAPAGMSAVRTPFEQTWTEPSPVAAAPVVEPVAPIAPAATTVAPVASGIDLSPYIADSKFMDSLSPQDRADLLANHADATHPMVPDSVRNVALQNGAEIVGRNLAGALPPEVAPTVSSTPAAVAGDTSDIDAILKSAGVDVPPKPPIGAGTSPMAAPTDLGLDPALAEVAAQRHLEAQSLPVPMNLTKGMATGDSTQISYEMNNRARIPGMPERLNELNDNARANLDAIRDITAPDVTTSGVSNDQALVDAIKSIDAPVRDDISAKYQALQDVNGGQFPLSGPEFVAAADKNLAAQNKGYFVPSEVKSLMSDYRSGGTMTYNDFENLRTILGAEGRKAARAGDGNAEHAISIVRNSLESLPMTDETAAIKPLADAARQAAAARFSRIASDPAYKAAVSDDIPIGEPSPIADDFIKKYVVNGKTANVRNLMQNVASNPTARQIIGAGVLDHIKQASGIDLRSNTGNVSQAGLNKAIGALGDKRGLVLDPQAAKHLETLGNVVRYTQAQPRGSYVNNSNTLVGSMAGKVGKGAEMAANAIVPGLGLGTEAANFLQRRAAVKGAQEILGPSAGASKAAKAVLRNAEDAPIPVAPAIVTVDRSGRPGIISSARRAAPALVGLEQRER